MALRVGLKINRFLKLVNRYKFQNVGQPYSHNSKPKCGNLQAKSASTLTKTQLKLTEEEEKLNSAPIQQNNFVRARKCMSDIPIITSEFANAEVTINRKFAKSSTHNAITQPLKLPRLANPFPEPLKTLASDTVSDDEKARLMQEQVKMEARYHLQMHQEMLLQNQQKKMNSNKAEQQNSEQHAQMQNELLQQGSGGIDKEQNQSDNLADQEVNEQLQQQQMNYLVQQQNNPEENNTQEVEEQNYPFQQQYNTYQQQQSSFEQQYHINQQSPAFQQHTSTFASQQQAKQPIYRKPTEYPHLEEVPKEEIPEKIAINTTEKNVEDKKENRSKNSRCRRKSHTRAARYLRNNWQPKNSRNQTRQYSTSVRAISNEPIILSEMEQCEKILKFLKSNYPQYKNLRKPILIPGSKEEKKFIQEIFKLNGQIRAEMAKKRAFAPFPSYSEMKLRISKPQYIEVETVKKQPKKQKTVETSASDPNSTKQIAPYPSYSEVYDEYEFDLVAKQASSASKLLSKIKPDSNKYYSTSSRSDIKTTKGEKQAKRRLPPCKNPFPPVPRCDYEETAIQRKEKKRKKHCPKKKKKGKTCSEDSSKIISKIKKWLSSYTPEENNIKVMKSPVDVDGRETYVIEVNEYEEINQEKQNNSSDNEPQDLMPEIVEIIQQNDLNSVFPMRKKMPFKNLDYKPVEYKEAYTPEMTDPVPVMTKIPEFTSSTDSIKVPLIAPTEIKVSEIKTKEIKNVPAVRENDTASVPAVVPPRISSIVPIKANEITIKEVEQKISANEKEVSKLKEIFLARNRENKKVNVVSDYFKPKPLITNDFNKHTTNKHENKKMETKSNEKLSRFKSMRELKNQQKKNPDNKLSQFKDFKIKNFNDILNIQLPEAESYTEESKNVQLPEPCPIVKRKLPSAILSPKKEDCNNSAEKEGCKIRKTRKDECPPQRKCRYKKKRRIPKCEDVKDNKTKTCMSRSTAQFPFAPPREHNSNINQKSYFKKSDKISSYINLKSEDIDMLAHESAKTENFEPFKLKPRFWKK